MRKITFALLFFGLLFTFSAFSQSSSDIPGVTITTLDGDDVNTGTFSNHNKPFVIAFWATWCRPCMEELSAIDEIYHEWQDHGFKLIAVSIDDSRTSANVLPLVKGRGWDYEFYLDENSDFRRAMGVGNVPHTFIIDSDGEVVDQHTSFRDGMEWDMFDKLIELLD